MALLSAHWFLASSVVTVHHPNLPSERSPVDLSATNVSSTTTTLEQYKQQSCSLSWLNYGIQRVIGSHIRKHPLVLTNSLTSFSQSVACLPWNRTKTLNLAPSLLFSRINRISHFISFSWTPHLTFFTQNLKLNGQDSHKFWWHLSSDRVLNYFLCCSTCSFC